MNDLVVQSSDIKEHIDEMAALSRNLGGCLSIRETRFLALAAAVMPPSLGEVLEIGSFKGKSTTLLAKSVGMAGGDRVVAVDPLDLPAETDPALERGESLPEIFRHTITSNGVEDIVEFHQLRSDELAAGWDRPLRLLWIDGDHTYQGARTDFDLFARYLQPGSVIAMHDVLHPAEGPIRVFCEQVLLSSAFGPCGLCGSIGWAQYLGENGRSADYAGQKIRLYRKLSRLIQFVALGRTPKSTNPLRYRILRPLVPHGEVRADRWRQEIEQNLPVDALPGTVSKAGGTHRKLIDAFIFFNEMSTLNMRLHELYDYVDWFVIVEATITHAGDPKPLYYGDNKGLFKQFEDKIIHYVVDDMPEPNDSWGREFYQRDALVKAVRLVPDIQAKDIVLISDADEVPNPKFLNRDRFDDERIFVFNQRLFYYDFTTENPNGWPGTMSIPYRYFADIDLNDMRKYKNRKKDKRVSYVPSKVRRDNHAGWHCTCFGGVDRIITKFESWSHQRYNTAKYKDKEKIAELIRNKEDIIFRRKKKYRLCENDEQSDPNLPAHWQLIYEEISPSSH